MTTIARLFRLALELPILLLPCARAQNAGAVKKAPPVIAATVCKILQNPSSYNNKFVKVRGHVDISGEYSFLVDDACSDYGIWFSLGGDAPLPGLVATIQVLGNPGGKDSKNHPTPPIRAQLIKDANFRELQHFLEVSAKGDGCADGAPPSFPPDCTSYQVTATFAGRIDSISKELRAKHPKEPSWFGPEHKGFGHMGMLAAQLVVQSVENVVAVDKADFPTKNLKPITNDCSTAPSLDR